ncbi:MAG: hypothetical protein EA417_03535 [Gammaproteobacteria bacterium]|nr:MAG: hypothetical protein EA417_03535 [Gammaproteobacteria bacterium]
MGRFYLSSMLMILIAALTPVATLASPWEVEEGQRLQAPTTELNIDQAANRAQQRYGGQLISIRPAEQDGRHGWQATVLLDNGRVKTLFVEARTGAVVERRRRN